MLAGFGNGAAVVCNALLVQRGAPDELRGRVFTVIMSSNYACSASAMVAAGALTDALGARWVWGGAAAAFASRRLLAVWLAPRRRDEPSSQAAASEPRGQRLDARRARRRASARGDRRALARAITLVENGDPLAYELVRELYPDTGRAYASASPARRASASRP